MYQKGQVLFLLMDEKNTLLTEVNLNLFVLRNKAAMEVNSQKGLFLYFLITTERCIPVPGQPGKV